MASYLENFYDFIKSNDPSYESKYSLDGFINRMNDPSYVEKINAWAESVDPNYKEKISQGKAGSVFNQAVQKQLPTTSQEPPVKQEGPGDGVPFQKKNSSGFEFQTQGGSASISPFGGLNLQQGSPSQGQLTNQPQQQKPFDFNAYQQQLKDKMNQQRRQAMAPQIVKDEATRGAEVELKNRIETDRLVQENESRKLSKEKEETRKFKGYVPELPQDAMQEIEKLKPSELAFNESYVVPNLTYLYGPLGFKFEEAGAGSNRVKVTAPLGIASIELPLNQGAANNQMSSEKLKEFLKKWSFANPDIEKLSGYYSKENKKIRSQEQLDNEVSSINKRSAKFNSDYQLLTKEADALMQTYNALNAIPVDKRTYENYTQKINDFYLKREGFLQKQKALQSDQGIIQSDQNVLNASALGYARMKREQGTWYGGAWNALLDGMASMSASAASLTVDIETSLLPWESMYGKEGYIDEFIQVAKENDDD
jgi:hypothetical protein